jgi:cytochrome b subunit of formate dehydrogenase
MSTTTVDLPSDSTMNGKLLATIDDIYANLSFYVSISFLLIVLILICIVFIHKYDINRLKNIIYKLNNRIGKKVSFKNK